MVSWPRLFSLACLVLAVVALVALPFVGAADPDPTVVGPMLIATAPSLIVGVLISWRAVAGWVGPLLALAGLIPAVTLLKDAIVAAGSAPTAGADRARVAAALGRATGGAWMLLFLPFALLLLVYPDGSLISRRWRVVAVALVAVTVMFGLMAAFTPVASSAGAIGARTWVVAQLVLLHTPF